MPFDEGILARWSRLKAEQRSGSVFSDPSPPRNPVAETNPAQEPQERGVEPAPDLDCTSLDLSSDFSRLVREGVSDAVQTAALRKLWVTNPLFGSSDGLDVYRADYARASPLRHISDIARRVLDSAAAQQCAADRSASSRGTPPNEVASDAQQETSLPPAAKEPERSD
jgi:hypothetical protein